MLSSVSGGDGPQDRGRRPSPVLGMTPPVAQSNKRNQASDQAQGEHRRTLVARQTASLIRMGSVVQAQGGVAAISNNDSRKRMSGQSRVLRPTTADPHWAVT